MKIYNDYNELLADSLEFSCHKVITSCDPEDFPSCKPESLQLLSVQITRKNLNLLIKLLRENKGEEI